MWILLLALALTTVEGCSVLITTTDTCTEDSGTDYCLGCTDDCLEPAYDVFADKLKEA